VQRSPDALITARAILLIRSIVNAGYWTTVLENRGEPLAARAKLTIWNALESDLSSSV